MHAGYVTVEIHTQTTNALLIKIFQNSAGPPI